MKRLAFLVPLLIALPAQANEFRETHGAWSVFSDKEKGAAICYMAATPEKETGDYTQRGNTYFVVAHDKKAKTVNAVSVTAGYPYKEGGEVTLKIGGSTFSLFTDKDTAWARDAKTDNAIVAAMRAGADMVVTGYSTRGTKTVDTYSLSGSTAAHNAINAACGVK